ncbi:hypothetical protein ACP70R_022649 [Stipagrostis hirtigluma subsp. patula]
MAAAAGMGRRQREQTLLGAAFNGNLRLLKKMARGLGAGEGEAAALAAAADGSGCTALHLAAMEGRMDVLGYLVGELRLDVDPRNSRGETPLFLSAFFGRTAAATYLLNHGADPMIVSASGSPLHVAAGKGHCEIVELLLSRGASVDLVSLCGTPLHMAAFHGQDGTMKILLEHHADPSKVLNLDETPLCHAIQSNSLACVKLLIEAGADVNFMDSKGFTYVMAAINTPDIMKCLLDAGANPNVTDEFGMTPIEVAAMCGRREIVQMLFPLTSPISRIPDWNIDGIISHAINSGSKPLDKDLCKRKRASLKVQAADAFKRKEYLLAGQMYTDAMELGPSDIEHATLLANRSLCWLRLGNAKRALSDATHCRMNRPNWPKACYRQGAAFMLLKEYEKASDAFADGLKLDPTNVEIENALRGKPRGDEECSLH